MANQTKQQSPALSSFLNAYRNHVVNVFTPPPAKPQSKRVVRKGGKR